MQNKDNVKKAWLKKFIQEDPNNVGLDSAILMNPKTWEASGHLKTFADPLIDCKDCKTRHRADKLINEYTNSEIGDSMTQDDMINYIRDNTYLSREPIQLSSEEVNKIIDEIFAEVNPTGPKDMGKVMQQATAKLKGKADMKEVSTIIRERLN